jgi:hypothetical protein
MHLKENSLIKSSIYLNLLKEDYFCPFDVSYHVHVPLNSSWSTTGGMRTTVWETLA